MANFVRTEEVTDYAMPLMNIERMAKQIHNHCLNNDYAGASELTLHLGAEVRILSASLAIMQNKETLR